MAFQPSDLRPSRDLLVLDFDIETRRVGFHNAGRFAPDGCEPVIVAAAFDGEDPELFSLGTRWTRRSAADIAKRFRERYEAADIVTGHYIRKFDLPIMNGVMFEHGLGPLPEKLVIDTKSDLLDFAGRSKSQENLSALQRLEASKFHMNDEWWREVARLTPEGLALASKRVYDDVLQHRELGARLAFDGWLKAPTLWTP